jgi:peptide-methionine (S)-S-oxide reductase
MSKEMDSTSSPQVAVFGGGCFWCTEAVYEELKGVISVMPGYAGGQTPNPTYESVSTGKTGHAEVIKIEFDPSRISYDDLLTVFFATHDPTTLNRQGSDTGTQYRSIILYASEEQKRLAGDFINKLNEDGKKVVTELKPLDKFYEAEEYHRDFYKHNPDKPYCQIVINPKIDKLKEKFNYLLKQSEN